MRRIGLLLFQAVFLGCFFVSLRNTEGQLSIGKPPKEPKKGRAIHPDYYQKVSILHSQLSCIINVFTSGMF